MAAQLSIVTPTKALKIAFLCLMLLAVSAVQAAPFAYIPHGFSRDQLVEPDSLTVIDLATNTVTAEVKGLGSYPTNVAVSPTGNRVYVASEFSNELKIVDTVTNTVIGKVVNTLGNPDEGPLVAVNNAGTKVYLINQAGISIIDTSNNTIIGTIPMGGRNSGLVVSPDGSRLYRTAVDNNGDSILTVIDTLSNNVIANLPIEERTARLPAINLTGTRVYVPHGSQGTVSVIDTATNSVIKTIRVGVLGEVFVSSIAVNPNGKRVYAAVNDINSLTSKISVIDAASNTVIASAPVPGVLSGIAVNPSGTQVYAPDNISNAVFVIGTVLCNEVSSAVAAGLNTLVLGNFIAPALVSPPPPVPSPTDKLHVTGIEITQGIQDRANSILLIKERRTFVRVYVKSDDPNGMSGVTAALTAVGTICNQFPTPLGCQDFKSEQLIPVNPNGPRITISSKQKRSNLNDSFLFEVPSGLLVFDHWGFHATLSADAKPPAKSCKLDFQNSPKISLSPATTLNIMFVRLKYTLPSTGVTYEATVAEQQKSESWIRRTYPLSKLVTTSYPMTDEGLGSRVEQTADECKDLKDITLCAHDYIVGQFVALRESSGPLGLLPGSRGSGFLGAADVAYGLIPQSPGNFTRGACCKERMGAGPSTWATNIADESYAAHEIGHFLGRDHPLQGGTTTPKDNNYPYSNSLISDPSISEEIGLAGFDAGDSSLKIPMNFHSATQQNGGQNTGFFRSSGTYDIMGYLLPSWISDYTYLGIDRCLPILNPQVIQSPRPGCDQVDGLGANAPQTGDWLILFGNITPSLGKANIINTQRVDRIFSFPSRTLGTHAIRLLGTNGAILADYPFEPEPIEDASSTLGFNHVVPFVPGTQEIRIVDTVAGDKVLGIKKVSSHSPVINDVALVGLPDPATGTVTLGWTASDADGDPLKFNVYYIRNGGESLQPLFLNSSKRSMQIDTAQLGGGSAQFRVVVTDGVNSSTADTQPFAMANKPPRLRIQNPGDGTTIHLGQLVNLEGIVTDLQEGAIPDDSMVWTMPGRTLGTGSILSVTDLPIGINKVTLTATNSLGLSDATSVIINVKDNPILPDPNLTVGPNSLGWNVGAGETQLQEAELNIGNSGSGNLKFNASSSATWLTLSMESGSAPATLTLSADPTGFAEGVRQEAKITLTAEGFPDQVITVPVTLFIGNTFTVGQPNPVIGQLPIAHAGPDQTVRQGSLVTLNGNASNDPNNSTSTLTYAWTQTSGLTTSLAGGNTAIPKFTPSIKGNYTFTLVVNNGQNNSVPDNVNITVPSLGDTDLDGDVDSSDLSRITSILNKPASSLNDLRDINGDMRIDALDTRKLVLLCTRPRCATQ